MSHETHSHSYQWTEIMARSTWQPQTESPHLSSHITHLVKSSEGQVINKETEIQIWISPYPI